MSFRKLTSNCSIHGPLRRGAMNRNRFRPVEVKKRGNRYQFYYYSPEGKLRRPSAGSDYQLAQRMAVRFTDWLMDGKDPEHEMERARKVETSRRTTLRELYPVFIEKHGSKQSKATFFPLSTRE